MNRQDPMPIRLSLCIGTYNREHYLRAALDNIVDQIDSRCEIVISDNASTDRTEDAVREYAGRCSQLRYFRNDTNLGLDRNFDSAVARARGEYCWLMSDDDLIKPGAVEQVLQALEYGTSVVIVNVEYKDSTMSQMLQQRALPYTRDRMYGSGELDRLFAEMAEDYFVSYIGNVVVQRDLWLSRDRTRFFGYGFIQIGVVYQAGLPRGAFFIATPLVTVRMVAHPFSINGEEVMLRKWPQVLAHLPVSPAALRCAPVSDPTRAYSSLLVLRASALYSREGYERWIRPQLRSRRQGLVAALIARTPFVLVNSLLILAYSLFVRFTQPNARRLLYAFRMARKAMKQ